MPHTTEHVDHLVVGGGVMGSATAWQLARDGRDVVLLERFSPGHVHGASHGASRIYRTTYTEPEYLDLAQESLGLWRELEAETGTDLLTTTGGVSHGRRGPDAESRATAIGAAFARRGIAHEWLPPDAASERWPGIRFEGRVLHETETAGRLHADRAVAAFQRAAVARGAQVRHETSVVQLRRERDRVRVTTDRGDVVARVVVVAVGAWTTGLLGDVLGQDLPLVVTQEQPAHFALAADRSPTAWPAFTHDVGPGTPYPSGVYGLLTPGEGVKVGFHGVGPVTDPDRRTYRPEPGQAALLLDYVRRWLPGLDPDASVPVSCTYTTTPDHDFVLDRSGALVVGAGFSGHGFKFAPAIGRVLADLALGRRGVPATTRFALARFAARSVRSPA